MNIPSEKGQGLVEYALVLLAVAAIIILLGGAAAYFLWNVPVVALTGLAAITYKQAIIIHLIFAVYFGSLIGLALAVKAAIKGSKK